MATGENKHTYDVKAIGEGQLRLGTEPGVSLEAAHDLSVHVAGAEGNVVGLLARLGNRTGILTSLPANSLGHRVANEYRSAGVDTTAIVWRDTGRLALYFVETSAPPIPTRVTYDRADSCFARLAESEVDWEYLSDARVLHLTGITAALGDNLSAILLRAAQNAARAGQEISVDVNYRSELTTPGRAREALTPLLESATVISCSKRDAATVFDLQGSSGDVAQALQDRFGATNVLVSDGPREAAVCADGTILQGCPPNTTIVDRVGAGDALVAGFLHGHLRGDPESGLRLGIAAAALALTHHGDQVRTTLSELDSITGSFSQDIVR